MKVNNIGKTTSYLPKGKGDRFAFKPGMNEIDPDDLTAIINIQNGKGDKWNIHYSKHLKVITDAPVEVANERDTDESIPDEPSPSSENGIDDKTVLEIKEVIAGMDVDELNVLTESESERKDGPRKTVMSMIEKAQKNLESENE